MVNQCVNSVLLVHLNQIVSISSIIANLQPLSLMKSRISYSIYQTQLGTCVIMYMYIQVHTCTYMYMYQYVHIMFVYFFVIQFSGILIYFNHSICTCIIWCTFIFYFIRLSNPGIEKGDHIGVGSKRGQAVKKSVSNVKQGSSHFTLAAKYYGPAL